MNAREWRSRPLEVRILDRCDECGELKEDVHQRVNYWPNISAVCCAQCFAEMTGEDGAPVSDRELAPACR
jgi:hypothetical protein